jgi:arginyl-tRNA synthetase
MTEAEKNQLFEQIGMGGLKYYLLKVDPKKRMLFNPEESIELNGHTGPFIQYTHARICSLLTKAGTFATSTSATFGDLEKDILKLILEYPEVIEEAAKTHSPSVIANYAYELVKSYNHFYQNVTILQEENEELKNARLTLSEVTVRTIASSLKLIGIDSPRKM